MIYAISSKTNPLLKSQQGSFSIEASLVAPFLVLSTLTVIALALFVYQSYELRSTAEQTTERAAFSWNDARANEGLYSRLNEGVVAWFGKAAGEGDQRIELPVSTSAKYTGVLGKLQDAALRLPGDVTGELRLADRFLIRELHLQLQKPFIWKSLAFAGPVPAIEKSEVRATIVDPVEVIRLVDLTSSFTGVIQGRLSPDEAKEVLQEPLPEDRRAVPIRSESEAAAYLRRVTGGTLKVYPMPDGKSRVVDALDAQGVAHQAFYTYTEAQLRNEQLPKDVKLIRDGTVHGVVWHFFRRSGAADISPSLRSQLEREGVVIVVHE